MQHCWFYLRKWLSQYLPKGTARRVLRDICLPMFRAALLTITQRWEQLKCLSMEEWVSKIGYIHSMEFYSALKIKEILTHATTWVTLEAILRWEISHSQADRYCTWDTSIVRSTDRGSRVGTPEAGEWWAGAWVCKADGGRCGCTAVWMSWVPLDWTSRNG